MTDPERWLTITEAALLLKKRYHKARDLVLQGKLGRTKQDEKGHLLVTAQGVEEFKKSRRDA